MIDERLSAELEAALVRALVDAFDFENRMRFGNRLARPVFALSETTHRLGCWVRATRELQLSRTLLANRPWLDVTTVLQHEMAHQFVDEALGIHGETPHGESFQRVCTERGIDARAAGALDGSIQHGGDEHRAPDHVLERIRKLLALAGSSNEHEAELAMRKAHELMLRHNLEAAQTRAERGFEVRHLGDPRKRGTAVEREIACLLGEAFFVRAIRVPVFVAQVGRTGWLYEIVGTPANVDMAAHVWTFLLATADRLWQANRLDRRVRSGRDRLAYQTGVVRGFRDKLRDERDGLARGQGLVWVRDGQLDAYYHQRHPRITTQRSTQRLTGAHQAGREAGRTVVLHKPMTTGPSGTGIKRLSS